MVRLAHITDLHIRHHQPGTATRTERRSRHILTVLERLTPALKNHGADVLVVTGDLLDVPDEVLAGDAAYEPDVNWPEVVDADYRLFRGWLQSTGIPWVVIPGNHDDEAAFDRLFPDYADITDIAGLRFVCFRDQLDETRQPRRTAESRALFEAVTQDAAHDTPQVHVQHFTIDPPTFHDGWQYEYSDAPALKDMIETSGRVRAVLSGHFHPGYPVIFDNGVAYAPTPAFCETPYPYRLVDIELRENGGAGVTADDHTLGE